VLPRQDPAGAWRGLLTALNSDVADIQGGTTAKGIHLGAMAGTIDIALRCLPGLLARGETLSFDPYCRQRFDGSASASITVATASTSA